MVSWCVEVVNAMTKAFYSGPSRFTIYMLRSSSEIGELIKASSSASRLIFLIVVWSWRHKSVNLAWEEAEYVFGEEPSKFQWMWWGFRIDCYWGTKPIEKKLVLLVTRKKLRIDLKLASLWGNGGWWWSVLNILSRAITKKKRMDLEFPSEVIRSVKFGCYREIDLYKGIIYGMCSWDFLWGGRWHRWVVWVGCLCGHKQEMKINEVDWKEMVKKEKF